MSLRDEFPVCERVAFLNAGSDGPVPRRAVEAAAEEVGLQAEQGRTYDHFLRRGELRNAQRAAYAGLLGCDADEVSVTTCTTEGVALACTGFGRGDRVVTTDEEHPGVYGPLGQARARGCEVVVAPFDRVHEAVDSGTSAVVCSHVSWVGGAVAPAELAELDVPVVLDGAQGIGALPVDVRKLGCAAYAGAGQKWLCGPDGSGMLFVDPEFRDRISALVPSFWNLAEGTESLDAHLWPNGRAWDSAGLSGETSSYALASLAVLGEAGWGQVHARAAELAARFASALAEAGKTVRPRGSTTLVSWASEDPEAEKARAAEAGVVIRDIPGRGLLRASVGAWNDESDLERLLAVL